MNLYLSVTSDSHVPTTDNCAHLVFVEVVLGALACQRGHIDGNIWERCGTN